MPTKQTAHHSHSHHLHTSLQKVVGATMVQLRALLTRVLHIPRRYIAIGAVVTTLIVIAACLTSFLWPRSLVFSYAGSNCYFNPILAPDLAIKQASPTFTAQTTPTISISSYTLYSATTCITLATAPHETNPESIKIAFLGGLLTQTTTVTPGKLPSVHATIPLTKPIAPTDPLTFTLTEVDHHFDYRLTANNKSVTCQKKDAQFSCAVASLALAQGAQYPITVERLFKGEPAGAVLQQTITTVKAIEITAVSIGSNQIVYSVPGDMAVTFDKPVASIEGISLTRTDGGRSQNIGITSSVDGAKVTVRFNEPLPRQATFALSIASAKADDGGHLPAPYSQQFTTSGGPKVIGVSIGSTKVQPSGSFTLTFDSSIAGSQQLQNFIRIESGGNRLQAGLSINGNRITVSPQGLLACQSFSVKVVDGLKNEFGVSGGSGWQFNARTMCQSIFSIGSSVQGRGITGYAFGNGPIKIVFVGTLHGNEKSATYTLESFIAYLESNAGSIPADHTIIVIPKLNPDGFAANTRVNAQGVDLNRNFPANNWKSGVTMPDGSYQANGGGTSPLSEPETRALANYIAGLRPRLVLSYHAIAGLVAANESGDSRALATRYGQKSSFPSYGNEASGEFAYDTTGAFEDWLHDAHSIPGLLIELSTQASNEFARHRGAMWEMALTP